MCIHTANIVKFTDIKKKKTVFNSLYYPQKIKNRILANTAPSVPNWHKKAVALILKQKLPELLIVQLNKTK